MEKELENPEKNEKIKQPSQPKSAQPGRAPAPSNRRTPLVSGSSPSRAPSLPRSLPSGVDLSAPVFLPTPPPHALSLSLCLAGLDRQSPSHCPVHPFLLSLCRGPALSVPSPPRSPWTGACALAYVAGFLDHNARPRAQLPS
jgi:hypothetical protein